MYQFENTRREIWSLRQENATLKRFHQFQKQKADNLDDIIQEKDKRIKKLEREKAKLEEELEKMKLHVPPLSEAKEDKTLSFRLT